jgi:hypothetical protein
MKEPNSHPQSPFYPKGLSLALIVQTNRLQWSSCIPFDHTEVIEEQILHKHSACPNLPSEEHALSQQTTLHGGT